MGNLFSHESNESLFFTYFHVIEIETLKIGEFLNFLYIYMVV